MIREAFAIHIDINELMSDQWKTIFGRWEAVKEIEDLIPLFNNFALQVKEFIDKNGGVS